MNETTKKANSGISEYFHRIFQSIFPDPLIPKSEQERKRYLLKNLILHFRPSTVPEKTLKFSLTWGLGGMAATLVLLQFVTGLLLKFVYEPTPVAAYTSILVLQNEVVFGQLIRNMHHWSANLLVLIVFLHMLRFFFTGAFHPPRQCEVLTYVITGMLNKQIAYALEISEKTVKVHRGRIMEKLGIDSVAELVRLADKAGIEPAQVSDP
jgi:DNA-binding CsgD family transcriptional regulator